MANFRFRVAEETSDTQLNFIKGLRFQYFESAKKIAQRLSGIHLTIQYYIIDDETGEQYKVERLEEGGKK